MKVADVLAGVEIDDEEQPGARSLLAELSKDEDLVAVLRGHLHVENVVMQCLELLIPGSSYLVANATYQQRCNTLRHMKQITADGRKLLKALGDLRNAFAHQVSKKLLEADANSIFNPLDAAHKAWVSGILAHVNLNETEIRTGVVTRLSILCIWLDMMECQRRIGREVGNTPLSAEDSRDA